MEEAAAPLTDAEKRLLEANRQHSTKDKRDYVSTLQTREDSKVAVDVEDSAEELKEKGNARFARGDDAGASGFYTRALKVADDRGLRRTLFSNRSAARLRGKDPEGALADAEECLKLGPGWGKGLGRRGMALLELGRFQEALQAFSDGLLGDPNNVTLVNGKRSARDALDGVGEYAPPPAQEEQDPLAALFSTVEEIEKTSVARRPTLVDHDAETKGWTRENQVERVMQKHHKFLNLNPYQVFALAVTANEEDVKKRFHKLSSLVHPDKNPDPRAREAFEIVKAAEEELKNPERRSLLLMTFHECRCRVEAARNAMKKKLKLSEEALEEREGALEDAVQKEIKVTLAQNEQDRVRAETLRQKNEEFLAARARKEEPDWAKVQKEEQEFKEGREERQKGWAEFAKKQKVDKKGG